MKKGILKTLILSLLLSSLPIKIIHAEDLQTTIINKDFPIEAGQRAGYKGFLTTPPHYLQYTNCMDNLPKCSSAIEKVKEFDKPDNTVTVVLITTLVTLLVCHAAHC